MLKPLPVFLLAFIIISLGIFGIYLKQQPKQMTYRIALDKRWLGVIDLNQQQPMTIEQLIKGMNTLLVVDQTHLLASFKQKGIPLKHLQGREIHIRDLDFNQDGLIDQEDSIFPFLNIVSFLPEGGYLLRGLLQAGIRAISLKNVTPYGLQTVILSDGSRLPLLEISQPDSVSIYQTHKGVTLRRLQQQP